MSDLKPLFVDLDGTIIEEDLSNLAFLESIKKNPLYTLIYVILFIFFGKAFLKEKISKNFEVPVQKLKFNTTCLEYIKNVKKRHRVVYLISGSHQCLVNQINNHTKIFFEAFGTDKNFNMVGINKVKFIREKLKFNDFDYIGNSKKDLPIWDYTKFSIFTNVSDDLRKIINLKKYPNLEIKKKFDWL